MIPAGPYLLRTISFIFVYETIIEVIVRIDRQRSINTGIGKYTISKIRLQYCCSLNIYNNNTGI